MLIAHEGDNEEPACDHDRSNLADFPPKTRTVLRKVRTAIRKALPGAEETISYRIPAFKLYGRVVIYFAGWKAHYSLYPVNARLIAELGEETAPYEVK
jgi:uncharacterized protein YdhG (YjbR/CyaY superfamily)